MTAPSLAWDAMLLKPNVKLELLYNLDMFNMLEKMKRGGLCVLLSNRYARTPIIYMVVACPNIYLIKISSLSVIFTWLSNNQPQLVMQLGT